jgi:Zn-dependent protease with chaperone function
MVKKLIVLILLVFIGLPTLSKDSANDSAASTRLAKILAEYKFATKVYHKKCGLINAYADGEVITVCDEMLDNQNITDEMLVLILFHEEGHHIYKHVQKRKTLLDVRDSLNPTEKTYRLFEKSIVAYIQQNEFEADEHSYKKAIEQKLSINSCYALKMFTPPSNHLEDDEDSTHPTTWKRIHRCLEVFNPNLYPTPAGQDNSSGLSGSL